MSVDDDEVQRNLNMLRDGSRFQKFEARLHLARVCEQRGMLDEAVELLDANIAAGHRTPEVYEWLARLHKAQGRTLLSGRMLVLARRAEERRTPPPTFPSAANSGRKLVGLGILCIVVGVGVTIGTYEIAAAQGGGRYLVWYGLVISGGILVLKGLAEIFPRDVSK